jgi:cbb3-type cytochrome oxidase maturation protein
MEILVLQVFVSLMLVGSSLLLFWFTSRQRDFDHTDRLALLPLEADVTASSDLDVTTPTETKER